jgi:hypothetical protein
VKDLELFYSTIHVIYIPSVASDEALIALSQIDALQTLLQKEHDRALQRRKEFRLIFTTDVLSRFVWRALELFSRSHDLAFNWSTEATREWCGSKVDANFQDLWNHCASFYSKETTPTSTLNRYILTRKTFILHVEFCFHLLVTRKPPHGVYVGAIPNHIGQLISLIDQILLIHAPCAAKSSSGIECLETQDRHESHHQGLAQTALHLATRWRGQYQPYENQRFRTFRETFVDGLKWTRWRHVSLSKSCKLSSSSTSKNTTLKTLN